MWRRGERAIRVHPAIATRAHHVEADVLGLDQSLDRVRATVAEVPALDGGGPLFQEAEDHRLAVGVERDHADGGQLRILGVEHADQLLALSVVDLDETLLPRALDRALHAAPQLREPETLVVARGVQDVANTALNDVGKLGHGKLLSLAVRHPGSFFSGSFPIFLFLFCAKALR